MKKTISLLLILALCAATGLTALAADGEPVSQMDILCAASGLAETKDGDVLVTDVYNKCVWKLTDGKSTRYAGADTVHGVYDEPLGGYNDAALTKSYFKEPWAIAPFRDGWAVSDTANHVVRLIGPKDVETINPRTTDKTLTTSDKGVVFDRPTGLATDDYGNLYVADTGAGKIIRITPAGLATVYCQELNAPTGLCWHGKTLYVAETGAHRVVKIVFGQPQTVAGSGEQGYRDGAAKEAMFSAPTGVTLDEDGTVYVADTANAAVRRVRDGQVDTILAQPEDELATWPMSPRGLLIRDGQLLVGDVYAQALLSVTLD